MIFLTALILVTQAFVPAMYDASCEPNEVRVRVPDGSDPCILHIPFCQHYFANLTSCSFCYPPYHANPEFTQCYYNPGMPEGCGDASFISRNLDGSFIYNNEACSFCRDETVSIGGLCVPCDDPGCSLCTQNDITGALECQLCWDELPPDENGCDRIPSNCWQVYYEDSAKCNVCADGYSLTSDFKCSSCDYIDEAC